MVKKVIVADDRESWRSMYVESINDDFPDVVIDEAWSGSELTEKVLFNDYTLVITDNDMEGTGDGLRAIQAIRAAGKKVPIYFISGADTKTFEKAQSYGNVQIMDKEEFDSEKLVSDISDYLK